MSPTTARAVSMALLGGLAAALLPTIGLFGWAGFIAWGGFLAAGGDNAALKKTIAGNIFGAFLAWVALVGTRLIEVDPGSWLWVPRAGIAVAVTLLVLCLAARVELLSHIPTGLMGYAAVFAAFSIPIVSVNVQGLDRLTGLHMYNPFIQVALSMVTGAVVGLISVKLAGALSKK
jgi:hypothetical protein